MSCVIVVFLFFFFFKQKTAYEMRISDWSSDVCSSDLPAYDTIRPQADFIKRVEMIPMRDGVKLYTVIFIRKGVKDQPILLSRTPYDAKGSTARTASQTLTEVLPARDAVFVDDGYIRVYQAIRDRQRGGMGQRERVK